MWRGLLDYYFHLAMSTHINTLHYNQISVQSALTGRDGLAPTIRKTTLREVVY